jgi:hypothetical protein
MHREAFVRATGDTHLLERGDRQRLQVQQLGVRRVLLRQDEVAEGDGQQHLRAEPAVGDDADEVLGRERLVDRDGEVEHVLVLGELVLEHEELVVQHVLRVHVLDEHPEALGEAVHGLLELEVRRDGELDAQHGARDRQHVRGEVEPRELVHALVDVLTHLREADELT